MSFDKLFDGSDAHLLPEIELKQLIEDAAKLLGLGQYYWSEQSTGDVFVVQHTKDNRFNPLAPERGDLWKVAYAAKLEINFDLCELVAWHRDEKWGKTVGIAYQEWPEDDEEALKLAVLRAASAVWKARGER